MLAADRCPKVRRRVKLREDADLLLILRRIDAAMDWYFYLGGCVLFQASRLVMIRDWLGVGVLG